jgi:hypothetical protein
MDDPFTTAVDVGFDFGTGAGLVNAEEAVGALRVGLDCVTPLLVSLSFTKK